MTEKRSRVYSLVIIVLVALLAVFFYVISVPKTTGFIRGTVTIGPMYGGPCREGVPCYSPYADFRVNVYDVTGNFVVASTLTDTQGAYQIAIPAGQYLMYTKYTRMAGLTGGAPIRISVFLNQVTTLEISVDTGLR